MSLETDLLLDRRRLKRRLAFWRIFAVLVVVLALAGLAGGSPGIGRPYVARLFVRGVITEDRDLTRALDALASDPLASALVVEIDSPGGSVAGGEQLHDAIARVAAKKPVVAVMDGVAASAGYMIAVPAARIFCSPATLTGSIGVLLETGDVSGLLGKLGINADAIVSGPLKDQPSFTKPLSPEGRVAMQSLVMDMYEQFVGMVAAGRHMDPARVRALADGRAYTGRQALPLGLVDEFGGDGEARAWLEKVRAVPSTLPEREVQSRSLAQRLIGDQLGGRLGILGLPLKLLFSQDVMLDGGWALWQPSGE
jgi:protease-4